MLSDEAAGKVLETILSSKRLALPDALVIGKDLCATLGELHAAGRIHKGLLPSNVRYDPGARRATILDLSETAPTTVEAQPTSISAEVAYVAPERTGRLQAPVDGRADLYSVGAILYRVLVGKPPFMDEDPLELMHAVLAKVPPSPRSLMPEIPQAVDDIVMTLLRKAPDERYASATGVQADLAHCLDQLEEGGAVAPFPLRTHDVGTRLELPMRLYGRRQHMADLGELFTSVQRGEKRFLLIDGAAGTGKSSLVRECHSVFTLARGVFVEGKFDQYRQDAPYLAWRQAISDWTRQVLTLGPDDVEACKQRIADSIGGLGRVLTDLVPDLALVIGPQPEIYPLGGAEAQNRFNLVVSSFVRAIASAAKPLVLFQDDMQWADPASLALLETLLLDPTITGLFVIGAYRTHELGDRHPLKATLEHLEARGARPVMMSIGDLAVDDVAELLTDALHIDTERARELARLICAKTAGNPFFVHRMLHVLVEDGLLSQDVHGGGWSFSAAAMAGAQVADNVVDLLLTRMKRLSLACRKLLARAALLGNVFTPKTLATTAAMTTNRVRTVLAEAEEAGLLSLRGENVRFAHDRIQQAAQSLVTPPVARALHLEIGQRLLSAVAPHELEEHVYDIVNHLNESESLIVAWHERRPLAELNLLAARKAKRAVAYDAAAKYLNAGLKLLEHKRQGKDHGLWLATANEALEAHFLRVDFEAALALCDAVDQTTADPVERAKSTIHRILIAVARMQAEDALRIGTDYLATLGIRIGESPASDLDPEAVLKKPPMTDPRIMAAVEVLLNLFPSAYMISSEVLVRICHTVIGLCMEYGSNPALAYVYAVHGLWACGVTGDIERGYRLGKLALDAWQQLDARKDSAKVLHVFNNCIRFWKEPELTTIDETLAAVKMGIEYGDTETVGYATYWYSAHKLFACADIESLVEPFDDFIALNARHGMRPSETGVRISRQCVANLRGDAADPAVLVGEFANETYLRHHALKEKSNRFLLYWLSVVKLYLSYLFGRYDTALESASVAHECETPAVGITVPLRFLHALACFELAGQAATDRRRELLERAAPLVDQLARWAKLAPQNFAHRHALLLAERARVAGQIGDAFQYYTTACEEAARQGYTIDLAIALERLGRFHLDQKSERVADTFLREAVATYRASGMRAKADHLVAEARQRLVGFAEVLPSVLRSRTLDVETIIKAARSFSSEIVLDQLLRRILDVVVKSTGAQKGFLLLANAGVAEVVAETRHDLDGVQLIRSGRVDDRSDLCAGIVHYVSRTGRTVVLRDAATQGAFCDDPYVRTNRPRSILCLPLSTHLGRLSGIVYLENNLVANAFTEERSELLGVLSSLMAISLDNARLYSALREELARREQAEHELRRSEENLSVTLRSLSEGVVTTNAEDCIVTLNPAAEKIAGHSAANLVGRPYAEAIVEKRTGETVAITDHAGIERLIEGTIAPITDAHGARIGSVRVLRDVTEKRQREAYFLQSQRLDIIGQLAGGIAHDFNNQLVAIMGYAEMIALRASSADPAEIKQDAQTVVKAAQGAADLTRRLLMLGRKVEVEKTVFDAHEMIRETMSLLQRSLARNVGVYLSLDAPDSTIAGDRTFLQNAILNIGINARDAMPSGGTLDVRTDTIAIPGERPMVDAALSPGAYLRIMVRDSGVGMSPEVCRRVCEPFFTTKEKGHGTGLGLATAYATLRSHGGWLVVASELGKGTTVTLYLPTAEATAHADEQAQSSASENAPRRLRLLVVDDEKDVRTYLQRLLSAEQHEVCVAENGDQAIAMYRDAFAQIDCVILDMLMPGTGGRQTFEVLRQINPDAKIVIITGYAQGEDLDHVLRSGAVGVLRKPFYREDILSILRAASQPVV